MSLLNQLNAHIQLNILLLLLLLLSSSSSSSSSSPSNVSYMFRRILHHPQGRTLFTCSKLSAYCNVVTLVTKHTVYRGWVLQRCLQLLEQL